MIEPILHLFKIHWKVILGNTTIIVQNMLRKTPKSFDTVDMVLGSFVDHSPRVVYRMVLPESLQRIVASEGVGVVDRSLPRLLSDNGHKFLFGHMLHNPRIDPSVAFQKAEYNTFTSSPSSALSFSLAAEVALVHFNLTIQLTAFKLGDMIDRFAKTLVDSRDRLIVGAEVTGETIRRLLLVEALDYRDFLFQLFEGFLFSTGLVPAPDVASTRSAYLERSTKDALLASQKVGRAPENVLLSCNHKDILDPLGYYYH